MTTTTQATSTSLSDEQLWQESRAGSREAFGLIVQRYQSLVCSLAYSASGSLSRSEDLAQETFVTAWKRQADLRDPSKLRAWLSGIARNLAANAFRREQRRGGPPRSLDAVPEQVATDADPAAHAVTSEEAALLWSSLGNLPESYREPLILFYRQGQSVADVAAALDLSEDAVKQRLSRGRLLLREEMIAVVESALARSRPGSAFTVGVLVALPMLSASTAAVVTATGTATTSGASTSLKTLVAKVGLGAVVGPVIGLLCAYWGTKAAASTARSAEERACILRYTRYGVLVFCFVMIGGLIAVLSQAGNLYTASALWIIGGVSGWTALLVGGILLICARMDRQVVRIRIATHTTDADRASTLTATDKPLGRLTSFESQTRLFGLPLVAMEWGGRKSGKRRSRLVCGWIAVGDVAVSPLVACGGIAIAPIAAGAFSVGILSLSLVWGVAVGVFALGSVAFGWWALGCAAAGVTCAVGFVAVARDHAVGFFSSETAAGTVAAEAWLKTQGMADFHQAVAQLLPGSIVGALAIAVALDFWRRHRN